MRFITEFKVPESAQSDKGYIPEKRHLSELKMGNMLAESFGWKNPVNHNLDYHSLEIEAFPMDKWVEFKMALFTELQAHNVDQIKILQLIKELESFGKPSGDAITNLSGQMEYRGPSSHCKACEDEKKGVKHIMAQKHTCRK